MYVILKLKRLQIEKSEALQHIPVTPSMQEAEMRVSWFEGSPLKKASKMLS
jgi:hypothetical protein